MSFSAEPQRSDRPRVMERRGEVRADHLIQQREGGGGTREAKRFYFLQENPKSEEWEGGRRWDHLCMCVVVVEGEDGAGCAGLKSQILNQFLGL